MFFEPIESGEQKIEKRVTVSKNMGGGDRGTKQPSSHHPLVFFAWPLQVGQPAVERKRGPRQIPGGRLTLQGWVEEEEPTKELENKNSQWQHRKTTGRMWSDRSKGKWESFQGERFTMLSAVEGSRKIKTKE